MNMKKILILLLSLGILLAFMPMTALADNNTYRAASISTKGAVKVTLGKYLKTKPTSSKSKLYQFTPAKSGYYGFKIVYASEDGGFNASPIIYEKVKGKTKKVASGSQSKWTGKTTSVELLGSSFKFKAKHTYYFKYKVYGSVENKSMKLVKFASETIKLKQSGKIKKVTVLSTFGSSSVSVAGKSGYVFKGFYAGKKNMSKYYSGKESGYKFKYSAKIANKTLSAKYSKMNAAQKAFSSKHVTGLQDTTTKIGEISLQWDAVSEAGGYEVAEKRPGQSKYVIWDTVTVNKDYRVDMKSSRGTMYMKVRAYKKINGSNVYTSWSSVVSIK